MDGLRVKRLVRRACAGALVVAWSVAVPVAASTARAETAPGDVNRYAQGPVYVELGVGAGGVKVGDLDFYPAFATLTLGAWPLPALPGVGIELFADTGLREGREDGFRLETTRAYGAALRFESPPQRGLSGYVVLGYTAFELSQSFRDGGSANDIEEEFGGARVSIGVVQRLQRVPALSVMAEYRKYAVEEGLDLDALIIGLRLSAP